MMNKVMFYFDVPGVGAAMYGALADDDLFGAINATARACIESSIVPASLEGYARRGMRVRNMGPPNGLPCLLGKCQSTAIIPSVGSAFSPSDIGGDDVRTFLGGFIGVRFVNLTERQVSGVDRIGAGVVRLLDNIVRPKPICPMVRAI